MNENAGEIQGVLQQIWGLLRENPATRRDLRAGGLIREGHGADLVLFDRDPMHDFPNLKQGVFR
jgi:dihydroorotase-like cyclic amidohydrolase